MKRKKYNINILNCITDKETSEFIDTMCSDLFYPTLNTPPWITRTAETLTNNICYNNITKTVMAGNITTSISDHLRWFLVVLNQHSDNIPKKEVQIKSFQDFNKQIFYDELGSISWRRRTSDKQK